MMSSEIFDITGKLKKNLHDDIKVLEKIERLVQEYDKKEYDKKEYDKRLDKMKENILTLIRFTLYKMNQKQLEDRPSLHRLFSNIDLVVHESEIYDWLKNKK